MHLEYVANFRIH